MTRFLILLLSAFVANAVHAGTITGTITDEKGNPLPYASVSVKGSNRGANANSSGTYTMELSPGQYTLVCQFVGYTRTEKVITVTAVPQTVDFILTIQGLTLDEVIIKKGEDPAYEIIRQAIKKRSYYNNQVDSFTVQVYIKGLLRSRGLPKRIFGQKIERADNDGLDSAGRGILYLSESITNVSYVKPDKVKLDVVSTRESGGNGFGFSFPSFINFYQNNVNVFDNNVNPRGFISPIADGALNYYRYKYEGFFIEDGKTVNTIRVTPRRKNEPLFSGTIQIVEDEWRIHSLDLLTTKDYQLELIDTLKVSQLHALVEDDVWKTKNQVIYVAIKRLGIDVAGNFVNVYSDYNINPGFGKKYFGKIVMRYDTASNKRDTAYWNAVRPVALEQEEVRDYQFKDSVAKVTRDSMNSRRVLDSLQRNQGKVKFKDFLWTSGGFNRMKFGKRTTFRYHLSGLLRELEYNTVEGVSLNVEQQFGITPKKGRYAYNLDWQTRYGFSNTHLNMWGGFTISDRKGGQFNRQWLRFAGGKRVSQFNRDNPIDALTNEVYTLFFKRNYMKLYENWFGQVSFYKQLDNGLRFRAQVLYEDRLPVQNTTDFSFFRRDGTFLPNHPYELAGIPFDRNQALVAGIAVSWQPGQRYIQYPTYKMPLGSKMPTFELEYNKGIPGVFGSDADFDKWKVSVADKMNFKLKGELHYRVSVGGFFNSRRVDIPDLQHFNGNQTFYNLKYLNSFQLAPYYRYSNAEPFYALAHLEHHFNGLLTNKIPLLNKLKWNLVIGSNAFYVNNDSYYVEAFAGLENILKIFRVDFVNAYQPGLGTKFGVRVGFGGLLGGRFSRN
jgi:hypothetical protein